MDNKAILRNLGIVFMLLAGLAFASGVAYATFYTNTLSYSNTISMGNDTKAWGYVDSGEYHAVLNDGDIINVDMTVSANKQIDVTEFRFYNICNDGTFPKIGRFNTKVNNLPVLPTIGFDTANTIYVAMPECPTYGTTTAFIYDTNDTRGNGTFHYNWVYHGYPMKIKSIEYYVTTIN